MLVAQGRLEEAKTAFEASLNIAKALAEADPGNAGWRRDLSVSHNKIGDVLVAQGRLEEAKTAFEASLRIAKALAEADPGNAGWRRDLIVSYVKMSETFSADAATWLRRALQIAHDLESTGRLAPRDAWMVADLRKRLDAAGA